jgi:hypothetical protein
MIRVTADQARNINIAMGSKDTYFVAVKVFLVDSDDNLLIIKDRFGDWDLPGGRLREQDFYLPLEDIVKRKVCEELGKNVNYKLTSPSIFIRHEREEILTSGNREKRKIFALGYITRYQHGDIKLGNNHKKYEWVPVKTFKPETRFTGGWLRGVKYFQIEYANFLFKEK